jgi:hypothetical protein
MADEKRSYHFQPGNQLSAGYKFKPGQSGNPGGRPKKLREIDSAIVEKWGPKCDMVLARLYGLALRGSVHAAAVFLERVLGKARAHGSEGGVDEDTDKLSDEAFWETVLDAPGIRDVVLKVLDGGKGKP